MDYTGMAEAEAVGSMTEADWDGERIVATGYADELAVRDALLKLRALDAERERLSELAEQIVDRYHQRGEALRRQADAIRASVFAYISERNGGEKVAFPDVGTAYLTTRKAKAKVADAELFESEAKDQLTATAIDSIYDEVFNAKRALELVLDELGLTVTTTGSLVTSTGEVFDLNGVEVEPESKTLAIRSA